jgi:hypothetical protein
MTAPDTLAGARPGTPVRLLIGFLAWRESGRGSATSRARGGPGLRFLTPADGLRFLHPAPDRAGCYVVADATGAAWRCPATFLAPDPAAAA